VTPRSQLAHLASVVVLAALVVAPPAHAAAPAAQAETNAREAMLAEYRRHLVELNGVVAACAKARDTKSCDAALAGQDDRVPLSNAPNAERRLVRYEWLRVLLTQAQKKDEVQVAGKDKTPAKPTVQAQTKPVIGPAPSKPEEPALPPKPVTSELLQAAEARLTQDIAQADALAGTSPAAPADHAQERAVMKQVLSGRDFRNLEPHTKKDSLLEKLGEWLNRLFSRIGNVHAASAWVGRALTWGFVLIVCVLLAWRLVVLERRWRTEMVPESMVPALGAASARDWQLWLADARHASAAGQWREAIHFVYWAAISRLESKRLWPADRARTPREYLALVSADDPRKSRLAKLTGSFERVWYGGHAAGESDYQQAAQQAEGLISGASDLEGKLRGIEPHPSRKNKDAARMGHPDEGLISGSSAAKTDAPEGGAQ
jgi:hypothetical protein